MPTERPAFIHFLVPYLVIPDSWHVGNAWLRPAGWLKERTGAEERPWPDRFLDPLMSAQWPTISVPVQAFGEPDEIAVARNVARDSLAVLDLYRRARVPRAPTDRQSFGLAVDVYTAEEHRWVTDSSGALAQASAGRYGTLGPWTFTQEDIDAFQADRRLAFIDHALRTDEPTDLEARSISAIRTYALSRLVGRPALQIILLATAVEALLGDEYQEGRAAAGAHQLARRAAFAWCGFETPIGRHGPSRPACDYLKAADGRELTRLLTRRAANGDRSYCSAYRDVRSLLVHRNKALHGARLDFQSSVAKHHEWVVGSVILAVLSWITENNADDFAKYEEAILATA